MIGFGCRSAYPASRKTRLIYAEPDFRNFKFRSAGRSSDETSFRDVSGGYSSRGCHTSSDLPWCNQRYRNRSLRRGRRWCNRQGYQHRYGGHNKYRYHQRRPIRLPGFAAGNVQDRSVSFRLPVGRIRQSAGDRGRCLYPSYKAVPWVSGHNCCRGLGGSIGRGHDNDDAN